MLQHARTQDCVQAARPNVVQHRVGLLCRVRHCADGVVGERQLDALGGQQRLRARVFVCLCLCARVCVRDVWRANTCKCVSRRGCPPPATTCCWRIMLCVGSVRMR